jgi:hypothetical protein
MLRRAIFVVAVPNQLTRLIRVNAWHGIETRAHIEQLVSWTLVSHRYLYSDHLVRFSENVITRCVDSCATVMVLTFFVGQPPTLTLMFDGRLVVPPCRLMSLVLCHPHDRLTYHRFRQCSYCKETVKKWRKTIGEICLASLKTDQTLHAKFITARSQLVTNRKTGVVRPLFDPTIKETSGARITIRGPDVDLVPISVFSQWLGKSPQAFGLKTLQVARPCGTPICGVPIHAESFNPPSET